MRILYKETDEALFYKLWDEYISKYKFISYRYTLLNIKYSLLYSQNLIHDKSFVVIDNNNDCAGVAFVPIEVIDENHSISIAGGHTIAPLAQNAKIEKIIFNEIESIAEEYNIKKISYFVDQIVSLNNNCFNYLLKYGYIDDSTTNCIVDLSQDEKVLWSNLNKSYKPLINGVMKNDDFSIVIVDSENPDKKLHEEYRKLHHLCAGGITRDIKTFDMQYEMLLNDEAVLIGLQYQGKFIGFNYFFHFKDAVIYASGADDPQYEGKKIPIYHTILHNAIIYYKNRNFRYLEFSQPCGYNDVNGFNDYLTPKQKNISSFKRGMGAEMTTFFRGIKYLDKDLLLGDIENMKIRALENI